MTKININFPKQYRIPSILKDGDVFIEQELASKDAHSVFILKKLGGRWYLVCIRGGRSFEISTKDTLTWKDIISYARNNHELIYVENVTIQGSI